MPGVARHRIIENRVTEPKKCDSSPIARRPLPRHGPPSTASCGTYPNRPGPGFLGGRSFQSLCGNFCAARGDSSVAPGFSPAAFVLRLLGDRSFQLRHKKSARSASLSRCFSREHSLPPLPRVYANADRGSSPIARPPLPRHAPPSATSCFPFPPRVSNRDTFTPREIAPRALSASRPYVNFTDSFARCTLRCAARTLQGEHS